MGLTINILIDMIEDGSKPNENTYINLIRGLEIKGMRGKPTKHYNEPIARWGICEALFYRVIKKCIGNI